MKNPEIDKVYEKIKHLNFVVKMEVNPMDAEFEKYYKENKLMGKMIRLDSLDMDEIAMYAFWDRMESLFGRNISYRELEIWVHKMYGDSVFREYAT